jgi:hypothetical protein
LVQQVIDADNLAGVLGEAEEKSHRPNFWPGSLSVS